MVYLTITPQARIGYEMIVKYVATGQGTVSV